MKKTDKRNIKENAENKQKKFNKKNLPIFILIGIIIIFLILTIIYYVFLRYAPEKIISYNGYAIEGKTMVESLKSGDIENAEKYINLVEVHENDLLYKRLNLYYIGDNDKIEIDINYPIYINDGSTLLNLGENTNLITINYEQVDGYPEFMLTGGRMYNGDDLTRADGNQYIFLKSEDEIYTNVQKIKVKTLINEYEINEYSNIYFTENYITYYEMQEDGFLQFKRISDIDENTIIEVNGEELNYIEFLNRLRIIEDKENDNNISETENNVIENNKAIETSENTVEENNTNDNETTENEWQEGDWAKPEVSCTGFEGDVYSIRSNLEINDKANVITRGVVFEIMLDGRVNRRIYAEESKMIEITSLQPETEYEIYGVVYYNDESGIEQEEEFYRQTFTTKSVDELGTIDFSFENGKVYSNKIELTHLKLNNDINEEVIKGIARIQLEIDGVIYRLSNDQVNSLKQGKEITYETSETLPSNSKIKYEIKAFDKYGNELKEKNNTGETITSKQDPIVSIRITKQDVVEVEIEVSLKNDDDVNIENYRYEVYNQDDEIVKSGTLSKDKENLSFTDLNANGYYKMTVYGDYDLENGEGKKENVQLGGGSFVTRPIASLGYMQINIDQKELSQNSMKLGISVDKDQTDARLISILNKVEVVIYDTGKNTDDEQENGEIEIQRLSLTTEQVEKLINGEEIEVDIDKLISNTKYKVDVVTTVKQGSTEEVVEDKQNVNEIITLKMPAEVQIKNQFVTENLIDFDIRVEDIDGAILVDKVRIEVRDELNKLVSLEEMPTNGDYERKIYDDLEENKTYKIIIYAPQYNEGSTDETYHADYVLKEMDIYTEEGISGSIDITGLEKYAIGKNLINPSSKINWFRDCFEVVYAENYGIDYNTETKTLTLGTAGAENTSFLYDLSDYIGQEITISLKGKVSKEGAKVYLVNNGERVEEISLSNTGFSSYFHTLTVGEDGFVGFEIEESDVQVEIQELQAELGANYTGYQEFCYSLNLDTLINVKDLRNEITTKDYYVRLYKNDEQVGEYRYEEFGDSNIIENVTKSYQIDSNSIYKVELLIKLEERYYVLDSKTVDTSQDEIKGIRNLEDLYRIQPYGNYIVINDIEIPDEKYTFGSSKIRYEGNLDFNGKTITSSTKDYNYFFYYIGENGHLTNLVLDMKINDIQEVDSTVISELKGNFYGFIYYNYGTIDNVWINIVECTHDKHLRMALFLQYNYGTFQNFIINYSVPVYAFYDFSLIDYNYGTIQDGYIYGENIQTFDPPQTYKYTYDSSLGQSVITGTQDTNYNISAFVNYNYNFSMVQNIYSLVNIDLYENHESSKEYIANIVMSNNNFSTVQNIYTVGIGDNKLDLAKGPSVYTVSSTNVFNVYYFNDQLFTNDYHIKGNKLNLWNNDYQDQVLNGNSVFEVSGVVDAGYYPHLIMSDVMPSQEFISLPTITEDDLLDILTYEVQEQDYQSATIRYVVNNPSAEIINNIEIEDLDTEIISQEYSNRKSNVIVKVTNPRSFDSTYNVLSISAEGAFNSTYTREYEEGDRVLYIDFYKPINNMEDWLEIKENPDDNYLLMTDLDFEDVDEDYEIEKYSGILDGNNHTIKNFDLTDKFIIKTLTGTLRNINIENFKQYVTYYDVETSLGTSSVAYDSGPIMEAGQSSVLDNVHVKNIDLSAFSYLISSYSYGMGGLAGAATNATIRNCSVDNLNINITSDRSAGGLVGYASGLVMDNSFATNVNIIDERITSESYLGGLVGRSSGSNFIINNCYAQGYINCNNVNGGLIGYVSSNNEVRNCYSMVNVESRLGEIGGMFGTQTSTSVIRNNLSLGNMYSRI